MRAAQLRIALLESGFTIRQLSHRKIIGQNSAKTRVIGVAIGAGRWRVYASGTQHGARVDMLASAAGPVIHMLTDVYGMDATARRSECTG